MLFSVWEHSGVRESFTKGFEVELKDWGSSKQVLGTEVQDCNSEKICYFVL